MALLVEIPEDEPYLADVGFGESFREPLRWNDTAPQPQGDRAYRLAETPEGRLLSQQLPGKDWQNQYILSVIPRSPDDFAGMAHYHQTSPESGFTRNPLISQAVPDGRISLTDKLFIVTRGGQRTEYTLTGPAAYFEKLEREFGVDLLPELRQTLEGRVGPDAATGRDSSTGRTQGRNDRDKTDY
jgi:N-hydroxyarylamine O-acetyltransferase